jgi:protein-S-isoprenylcysteine O-methyltransferase Ste14
MLKLLVILIFLLTSTSAAAYIGPGAGISVLGSLLGILGTIVVAIGAILFWPIRKMMKRRKAASSSESPNPEPSE